MSNKTTVGLEIERKYIIKMPDLAVLASCEGYSATPILQIYLPAADGETRRVRRRVMPDRIAYIETRKIRVDNMSSTEIEGEITEAEFLSLAATPLDGTSPIEKTRHSFTYRGQLFEIDVYPQWQHTAIMETELSGREVMVDMPSFIDIVREVTGIKAYSNAAMSREFPPEEK